MATTSTTSFIQAIRSSPEPLILANLQEISYLDDNEKLLYYTDGRIRREYNTLWRSIRPYTGINRLKEFFYPEIPFDEQIDNLKDFADFTWEHISHAQLGLRTAIAMQDIMNKAIDQLERLKSRYEIEQKPHNVTIVTDSIAKIQTCRQHLTRANKDWDQYLNESVQEILATVADRKEQINALWAKVKLYGAPEDMQLTTTGNLGYVCRLIRISQVIPAQMHGKVLCELLLKAYAPDGGAFVEKLKQVYASIRSLHQSVKGQVVDPAAILAQERKLITDNDIFLAALLE